MRKISLLTILLVACLMATATSASALSRWAEPLGNGPIENCYSSNPCALEDAFDTAYVEEGDRIEISPGEYTVATPLSVTAADVVVRGEEGPASATVINSTYAAVNSAALTLDNGAEAQFFSIDASGTGTRGLDVVDGFVDHLSVYASTTHACKGTVAVFVETLCHATALNASGFQRSGGVTGSTLSLTFINCTLSGSLGWYGATFYAGAAHYNIELFSTIVQGNGVILLDRSTIGSTNFNATYSNYGKTRVMLNGAEEGDVEPTGTNQASDASPWFVDPSSDFHQDVQSPTIQGGAVEERSSDTDLDGNPRVQGGVADIGAYESDFVPPVITPPTGGGGSTITPPVIIPDTTKPTLKISKQPKSKTTSKKLNVSFKANEAATYQCKLDKGKFKPCKSPYKKSKLKVGKHKLQIKATDAAGNVSLVKTIKWTVKKR